MPIPVEFTQTEFGFFVKSDGSGPYSYDGVTMTLVEFGVGTSSNSDTTHTQIEMGAWVAPTGEGPFARISI